MAYHGVVDDVRDVARGRKPRRLPVFACSEEFDVRWHGKYTYEELCRDGAKIAEVWIAAIEEFDYDWAWLQVDDCFEFEPLGVGTHGEGNILRATRDYLPLTRQTLEALRMPDPRRDGRMPEKLKALQLVRRHFGEDVLVVGSCAAPYSSTGLLCGLQEPMLAGLTDPDLLEAACDFFVQWQARYIEAQVEAGAHAIWLGDCNAFSSMLSLAQYCRFAAPSCLRLVEKIHDAGALAYLHNSEISTPHILAEAELGVDVINCGPGADMAAVRSGLGTALGSRCGYSGNLDPIEVLMRGTPAQVAAEATRLVKTCFDAGGYLFNTGEMNPRDVPPENMKAMIAAARDAAVAAR